jgi:hypothetical protein
MDWGYFVLGGIFVGAALLMVYNARHRRAVEQELLRRGLEPCEDEAPALQKEFTSLAGGHGGTPPRRYAVSRCFKPATGRGMVYRFSVLDRSHDDEAPDRNHVGAAYDAYLIHLPKGTRVTPSPVSVMLSPRMPSALRAAMAGLAKAEPFGMPLVVPEDGQILAAWGEASRPLDEVVPRATQERLVGGAEVGVLSAHFTADRAAFTVNPQLRMVEPQWRWIVDWT